MAEVPDAGTSAMEVDASAITVTDKIQLLPGYASDFSAATFCLNEEDHTLGNSLRWMLMKDPQVEFCGYSIPHPSETKIHLRIQMYDEVSVFPSLRRALNQLTEVFSTIGEQYQEAMDAGDYERYEEKTIDKEWLKNFKEEGQKRKAEAEAAQKARIAQKA
ncbi:unnamed protein product [Sympodiomycopsis kandeliae]